MRNRPRQTGIIPESTSAQAPPETSRPAPATGSIRPASHTSACAAACADAWDQRKAAFCHGPEAAGERKTRQGLLPPGAAFLPPSWARQGHVPLLVWKLQRRKRAWEKRTALNLRIVWSLVLPPLYLHPQISPPSEANRFAHTRGAFYLALRASMRRPRLRRRPTQGPRLASWDPPACRVNRDTRVRSGSTPGAPRTPAASSMDSIIA